MLVQFSLSVVSNSLPPHGLQHARLPCPSPMPGAKDSTNVRDYYQYLCNLSGPATNTRETEIRHRGPVLKERKKIVKNVGRAKKKYQRSSWGTGKYKWVEGGGQ